MIDWNGALEAVHTDGRVVAAQYVRAAETPGWIVRFDDREWFVDMNGSVYATDWAIRNRPSWRTSDEQLDRMDALVQRLASLTPPAGGILHEMTTEANALLQAREPVDPDKAIARQICDRSPYSLDGPPVETNAHIYEAVLAGIKYGRAQG